MVVGGGRSLVRERNGISVTNEAQKRILRRFFFLLVVVVVVGGGGGGVDISLVRGQAGRIRLWNGTIFMLVWQSGTFLLAQFYRTRLIKRL